VPSHVGTWRHLANMIELVLPSAYPSPQPKREIDQFSRFWATVCKAVRPMLSGPLSVLAVTLVYCGQTVRCIKIPLGMVVGLDLGHIVSDGDPAPPKKDHIPPIFGPRLFCCGQTARWIKMSLRRELGVLF